MDHRELVKLVSDSACLNAGRIDTAALSRQLNWPVALVSMPFFSPFHPSLQLGLLKSIALKNGFVCGTYHLHLDFAHVRSEGVFHDR